MGETGPKGQTDLPWPALNIIFVPTATASTEVRPCGTKHLEVEEMTVTGVTFEENQDGKCHVCCNITSSYILRALLQLRLSLLLEDLLLLIPELSSGNNCAVTEGQNFYKSHKWSINSVKHRCLLKDRRHNHSTLWRPRSLPVSQIITEYSSQRPPSYLRSVDKVQSSW